MRPFRPQLIVGILVGFLSACAADPATIVPPATAAGSPVPAVSPTPGADCLPRFALRQEALVTDIADGDSIEVEMNGVRFRLRYVGINAPELGQPHAEEARAANRSLVEGKTVLLVRDLSEADRYGRLLRFVFADGVFVNRELVRLGAARAAEYPPDLDCQSEFAAAENEARAAGLGLWGQSAPTGAFWTGSPAGSCEGGCIEPPPGCLIKGNINSEGEKIYHVPGGEYYDSTMIDPQTGERWFCTEEEAQRAGWRRSKV